MERIIYLLPVAVLFMGVQSCCCDKDDDDSAPVAAPAIQPNGDYPVDLGLSVKWATCNVGATTPEEFGDYYAWGDTATYYKPGYAQSESPEWKEGKEAGYAVSTYKYYNNSNSDLTKYCYDSNYGDGGYTDTLTVLTPDDDAAHYNWGGNWRMPTQAEFEELLDSCDYEYIRTDNNGYGMKFTSRKDPSQSIFLPGAGWRQGTALRTSTHTDYWSSSLDTNNPNQAWILRFDRKNHYIVKYPRPYGLSVRPVCP